MISISIITVGTLKEDYLREAVNEYKKRLLQFAKVEEVNIKEERIYNECDKKEIDTALSREGQKILEAIPKDYYKIALCVEGKQFSSEALAKKLEIALSDGGSLCLIIGSSHGLAQEVKDTCKLRLSVSELTFPHQMMRVLLLEVLYRSFSILKGTKYHK